MTRNDLLLPTVVFALAAGGCGEAARDAVRPTETLRIPGARERFETRKRLVRERLDSVLLPAMRAQGVDLWLVFSREHHTDPILSEIGGGWGGVRNAYLFFDRGADEPEKIFIGSHELRDTTIRDAYDEMIHYGYTEEGIRPHLREVVEERNPQRIGINVSPTLPMADGLTWTLRNFLEDALGPRVRVPHGLGGAAGPRFPHDAHRGGSRGLPRSLRLDGRLGGRGILRRGGDGGGDDAGRHPLVDATAGDGARIHHRIPPRRADYPERRNPADEHAGPPGAAGRCPLGGRRARLPRLPHRHQAHRLCAEARGDRAPGKASGTPSRRRWK